MDYEQKYVKALWQMKELYDRVKYLSSTEALLVSQTLENTFPELKESEDEMIRKELINFFSKGAEYDSSTNGIKDRNIIAWLEKQGEQKHNDKVEPKFKIEKCKWYVCIRNLYDNYANKAFCEGDIYLSTQDGSLIPCNSNTPYKVVCPDTYFRDWTIQDAKDGDVLYCKRDDDTEIIVMYSRINRHKNVDSYCRYNSKLGFNTYITNVLDAEHDFITPATKEQRDLLFSKIKEAGYEWDAEKKDLKKIEQNCYHDDGLYYAIDILEKTFGKVEGYQSDDGIIEHQTAIETVNALYHKKSVEWSEEDSKRLDRIHQFIWANRKGDTDEIYQQEQDADWLMTLKPQPKQEWSEEDEQYLLVCKNALAKYQRTDKWDASIISRWLESLKDRVQLQQKQEWNAQDEAFLGDAIYAAKNTYSEKCGQEELIDWLKTLKSFKS